MHLQRVVRKHFKFSDQLNLCANGIFRIAHHMHLLYLNQMRNCSELTNLHLQRRVCHNSCRHTRFLSSLAWYLENWFAIQIRSDPVEVNARLIQCSLKISVVDV
jgi:hypothetical protein